MSKAIKKTVYRTALKNKQRSTGLAGGFVMGLASMLVLAGPERKTLRKTKEGSAKALRGDFVRIGMDMRKAAATIIEHEKASR